MNEQDFALAYQNTIEKDFPTANHSAGIVARWWERFNNVSKQDFLWAIKTATERARGSKMPPSIATVANHLPNAKVEKKECPEHTFFAQCIDDTGLYLSGTFFGIDKNDADRILFSHQNSYGGVWRGVESTWGEMSRIRAEHNCRRLEAKQEAKKRQSIIREAGVEPDKTINLVSGLPLTLLPIEELTDEEKAELEFSQL